MYFIWYLTYIHLFILNMIDTHQVVTNLVYGQCALDYYSYGQTQQFIIGCLFLHCRAYSSAHILI